MNQNENRQAEELDVFLTELQSGGKPIPPDSIPEKETHLLTSLHELTLATQPSQDFVDQLGKRLKKASQSDLFKKRPQLDFARWWEVFILNNRRMITMNKRLIMSLTGIVVLIILCVVAGWKIKPRLTPMIASIKTVTTTNMITPTPTPLTEAPTETPGATVAPTQSVETAAPTPRPTTVVVKPSTLPLLSSLTGGGTGGGGGGISPETTYKLEATLPEDTGKMSVYQVEQPSPLTIESARQVAENLGMEPNFYVFPSDAYLLDTDPTAIKNFLIFDGSRRLTFDGSPSYFYYHDNQASLYYKGHWNPPDQILPVDQIAEIAKGFLESHDLFGANFQILPAQTLANQTEIVQLINGLWPLFPPVARMEVNSNAQVGDLTYRNINLLPAGEIPIISAQEAWQLVNSGQESGRAWYKAYPTIQCNPKFWRQKYQAGQPVDLFGTVEIVLPMDKNFEPRVTINEMILAGDLQGLAQQTLQNPSAIHAWGEVTEISNTLVLNVQGWEEAPNAPLVWMGTIQREAGQATLVTETGQAYRLPDLPADIENGARVFMEGWERDGKLDWDLIQAEVPEAQQSCMPKETPSQIIATVTQVDLIYFIPPLEGFGQTYIPVEFNYAQPAWRFSGNTDNGLRFEVWVQAVAEQFLK